MSVSSSPPNRFVMIPEALLFNEKITPQELRCYAFLRRNSDWTTGFARVTVGELAQQLGCGERRCQQMLQALAVEGFAELARDKFGAPRWRWLPFPPSDAEAQAHRLLVGDHPPRSRRAPRPPAGPLHPEAAVHPDGATGLHPPIDDDGSATPPEARSQDLSGISDRSGDPQGEGVGDPLPPAGVHPKGSEITAGLDLFSGVGGSGGKGSTGATGVHPRKPAAPKPPEATEATVRAGHYDDPKFHTRNDVIAVLVAVWVRDVWHKFGGRKVAPTTAQREREIRRAIDQHQRTPSGILEAFEGIPLHPWFRDTQGSDRGAAVEPHIAIGVGVKGFAPYDELRDLVAAKREAEALAAKGTADERDSLWSKARSAWLEGVDDAAARDVDDGERVPEPYRIGVKLRRRKHTGAPPSAQAQTWIELSTEGLTSAAKTQAQAANAYALEHAACAVAGRVLVERYPDADEEAKSGTRISASNLSRSLAKLASMRDAGTLFVDGGSDVAR